MGASNPGVANRAIILSAALLVATLLTFLAHAAPAQTSLEEWRKQYPRTAAVLLDNRQDITVEVVGDSVQAVARHRFDLLHLADQSAPYALDNVYSSHFNRLEGVEARSVVPNGRGERVLKVKDFKDRFDVRPGVFFDDVRRVSFTFPAVAPGVRTVTEYTIRHPDARFVMPFRFGSVVPTRHAELSVTLPRGARLSYRLFHVPDGLVTYTTQTKGSATIHRWVADNVPAAPLDDDAPSSSWYLPHVVFIINEVPVRGQPRRLLGTLDDLYALYAGFTKPADEVPGPALHRVIDSLTTGVAAPDERARRIYHWVQGHVRYIAFEDGLRGFVPSTANKVFADRYGDCKDMANLTHQMLKAAGVPSYLAWIGTRDLPYRYAEVATPGVDNHMIVAYEAAPEQYRFLDATGRHTSFGMPTSMIQGKEALLALDPTHCRVATVPVMPAARTTLTETSTVELAGTGLRGAGERTLTGYFREDVASTLDGLDRTQRDRYLQQVLERGNNKFFVDSYDLKAVDDPDAPLRISYQYRLEDYVQQLDDEVYVNLNLERALANDRMEDTRRLPRERTHNYAAHTRTILKIPAGYDIDYLPPAVAVSDSLLSFAIRYERQGTTVVRERDFTLNALLLPPAAFKRWNALIDQLTAAYRETVVLKRHKP